MKKYIAVLFAALLFIGSLPILVSASGESMGGAAVILSGTNSSSAPNDYPCPTRTLYYYGTIVFSGADDVKWVQSVLCSLGYSLTVDGSYGPATAEAVRQFQSACGLTADGITGPATRAKMLELLNGEVTVNVLHISDSGLSFICGMEGFHSACYRDSTRSSIGYGTKCTGSTVQPHASGLHTITKEAAMNEMRRQIAADFEPRVKSQTSGITMTQSQFDALVSLCYNCGGGSSMISNSPLVKYLKGTLTEAQARSEYSRYIVSSGGTVLQALIDRRNAEAELFFSDASESSVPEPAACTVSYHANGGSGAPGNQYKYPDIALTLSSQAPTWGDRLFVGWSASQDASTAEYLPGDIYTLNADLTLYALWMTQNVISGVSQENGTVSVTGFCAESQAQLVCAGYDSAGKLVSVQTASVSAGEVNCSFVLGTQNAAQVKVFLLDASNRPLCSAQEG